MDYFAIPSHTYVYRDLSFSSFTSLISDYEYILQFICKITTKNKEFVGSEKAFEYS